MQNARLNGRVHGHRAASGVEYASPVGSAGGFAASAREESVVSPKDVLRIIWRRLWAVVLVAMAVCGSAVAFSLLQTPTYQASIKLLVGQENAENAYANLGSDVQGLQQLTLTVAKAVNTRPVAFDVTERLGLPPEEAGVLLENTTVRQIEGTQFIEVYYADSDPEKARLVADTIGDVFSERISVVSPNANAITATVWEGAALPTEPVSPNPLRNGLVALVIGVMMGLGLAFVIEQLDDRWRTPEEVEQVAGVPTFGIIPSFKTLPQRGARQGRKAPAERAPYAEKGGR